MAVDRPVTAPQREDAEQRDEAIGRSRRTSFAIDFYRSAVGKKYVMAITGIILMAYVFAHMVGNLKMYLGPEEMNHYGEFLRAFAYPILPRAGFLWIMRLGLLAATVLHVHATYALTQMNRRSRPVKYQSDRDYVVATFAARSMRWTGVIVLLFIIFHLLDLTTGQANPAFEHGLPYENMVASFSRLPVALFYIVANLALGVHLYHGAWSLFQTLGWNRRRFNPWRRYFATAFAAIIVAGNVSFPLAVVTGVVSGSTDLLDNKIPQGSIEDLWDNHKFGMKLVNPNNKRKFEIIIIGSGLAGASAAATLGELGYNVKVFTFHDSPRRAHSIAAQGGINAAKNYRSDGDSVFRLFYDTVKGGDYRSREANVYRLAQVSVNIIDQAVAQGVPFAREYGGLLDNRSFGGAQVSRTFYARGQTGQQLLLGCYQQMMRQVEAGTVKLYRRSEMLEVVIVDGRAVGVIVRDLITGEITKHSAHAVVLATGGYSNAFYLSTNAKASNASAIWRAHRKGALFANPCFTQIHPTCIPPSDEHQSKLTLMSESLRNDGRIWVPKQAGDDRSPRDVPENDRDYFLERKYPAFGNLVPRDVASRNAKTMVDQGKGVGPRENGVYLDFAAAIERLGAPAIKEKYGNLFDMYERITGEDPYRVPMRIYPAPHYTMGGLWVDYNLMTTIPGLYAIGEANFSDHGANRLGASALMQGLADGYFVLPYTIGDYLAPLLGEKPVSVDHPEFAKAEAQVTERVRHFLDVKGTRTVDWFHRELGRILWDYCGMARNRTGLEKALSEIPALREEYHSDVCVLGENESYNQSLEKAGRVADFFELAELMCHDALHREESCGGHFREESQTEEGEALRDDEDYAYVAAWEFRGVGNRPRLHREDLEFEYVQLSQRSYK